MLTLRPFRPCTQLPAAALGGIGPEPPQLDVAALKLSAAAPLLAAPFTSVPSRQAAPPGGMKLLQHIFGGQVPTRRQL